MIHSVLLLFLYFIVGESIHFNGGTINWKPIYPYKNASNVSITVTQIYWWTSTSVSCASNVPISTAGLSNRNVNLTCMADCSTDGDYSLRPVNILTDCQTVSSSLNMMTSQRSVNINLNADAHFYLAYIGSAWRGLSSPVQIDLQWSIVTFIDLRRRPDGFINTPPVASVISPQYVVVNQTTHITIPVSDVNAGDVVRCRWSVYTPGYRRRRGFDEDEDEDEEERQHINQNDASSIYKTLSEMNETILVRNKRGRCDKCTPNCVHRCDCTCPSCIGTTCQGKKCATKSGCPVITTTAETPGTIKSTSTYPTRQAIDECGGICYSNNVSNSASLTNCTISFTGLIPDTWYAFAIQVNRSTRSILYANVSFFSFQ